MHITEESKARLSLISAMVIWGTIGIFRKHIPLSSSLISLIRSAGGMLFLLAAGFLRGGRINLPTVRKNAPLLILSGALIGFNWILLFESYRYTTVAVATLCYYMAPVIVLLASPLLLGERLTKKKLLCIFTALMGMLLVSGAAEAGNAGNSDPRGIALGLCAAVLYAGVILANKKMSGISATDRTAVQLAAAAIALFPYTLLTGGMDGAVFTPMSLIMLLIVAVVHTGLAYALYFSSMDHLPAQTAALMSYIDPAAAIFLSALVLHESMTLMNLVGAALILGSIIFCERSEYRR